MKKALLAAAAATLLASATGFAGPMDDQVQGLMGAGKAKDTSVVVEFTRKAVCDDFDKVAAVLDGVGMQPIFRSVQGPAQVQVWLSLDSKKMVEVTVQQGKGCISNMLDGVEWEPTTTRQLLNSFIGLPVRYVR